MTFNFNGTSSAVTISGEVTTAPTQPKTPLRIHDSGAKTVVIGTVPALKQWVVVSAVIYNDVGTASIQAGGFGGVLFPIAFSGVAGTTDHFNGVLLLNAGETITYAASNANDRCLVNYYEVDL